MSGTDAAEAAATAGAPNEPGAAQWLPIETAPKDGTYVLALVDCRSAQVVFWNGLSWDDGDFHDHIDDVTHWMPIPRLPKSGGE